MQAPRAGSSTSTQRIAASSHQVRRVPGRLHFWKKNCLFPPDVLPTSCRLPQSKGALPAYQDVLDALRNPLEHQGRRHSISRYLHFFGASIPDFSPFFIYRIFLHFHRSFLHFSWRKLRSGRQYFSPFFGEKSCLKATFFSIFRCDFVAFRVDLRLQSPIIIIFRSRSCT